MAASGRLWRKAIILSIDCHVFNMVSLTSSSFLLRFQICSQLSTRLEKQQAATKEELDAVRVS